MTARFDIDIKDLDKKFDKWARKFRQKKKIHRRLAELEMERVMERFITKTDPEGIPWDPMAASTVESRFRKGTLATGLLLDSGLLRDSIDVGITRSSFIIGTNIEYAGYQQDGTDTIPDRPFLGFNDELLDDFDFIVRTIMKTK